MELWGGVECTINRVRNQWLHQLELSGHLHRISDLDLIADLGIQTLRYPVLWEATAPDLATELDWSWPDARLARLRDLGIAPIVGLVHHGSGPRYTSLIDESFAPGLAAFAGRVAERYPWVARYTPVNEPLTTARFSGLYGLWYPHGRNPRCFARALINQCRATVLSMQAIRRFNPDAMLVQTEDLGTTYSTTRLQYQRDFNNERRWLTWDLLCGMVHKRHALYAFLIDSGISCAELDWFASNPCAPEIIGINHYVTSDRYLDERADRYAPASVGGNGKEKYADVEAVRVLSGEYRGFDVIRAAWTRYKLPLAVTEVHLGCSREDQLRWFRGAWCAGQAAFAEGCDVRAVTAWALFGTFGWDKLLTETGSYEPGSFDVRAPQPRPTAIARLIRELNAGSDPDRLVIGGRGWWQRPGNVLYGESPSDRATCEVGLSKGPPILICGASGSLGSAIASACASRGLYFRAIDRSALDICDALAVRRLLDEFEPWAVINAAGFVNVDAAERESNRCFYQNTTGAAILMSGARDRDLPYVTFSSDLVFDGATDIPYVESSGTAPLNEYGRSKEAAEKLVLQYDKTLCVRTAAFFGCTKRGDFVSDALHAFANGRPFCAAADVVVSPTFVPDLADVCLDLLIDQESGIFHLANTGSVSWAELARLAAAAVNVSCHTLQPRGRDAMNWAARRPLQSALRSERAGLMPTLADALSRYARTASGPLIAAMEPRKRCFSGS